MDLALTIFNVGVGIGAVLVGVGVIVAALSLRPLARDTRSLARDAARLGRMVEEELPALVERANRRTADDDPSPDPLAFLVAPRADGDGGSPGRPGIGSVQSPNAREDEQIA